jgi:hypothetical protein
VGLEALFSGLFLESGRKIPHEIYVWLEAFYIRETSLMDEHSLIVYDTGKCGEWCEVVPKTTWVGRSNVHTTYMVAYVVEHPRSRCQTASTTPLPLQLPYYDQAPSDGGLGWAVVASHGYQMNPRRGYISPPFGRPLLHF